jgi:hypothetical protein
MPTGRVAVTVQRGRASISTPADQERSSTYGADVRPLRRWARVLGALCVAAGLWAFTYGRAWGQTAPGVPGIPNGIASVLAAHLERFAAAEKTLTPSQQKVDSHLRRLAWPGQAEAQAVPPPLVPPPWQQGAWLHVYVHLHATTEDVLDELRARGLAIERVNDDFAMAQGWISPADLSALADLDLVAAITPVIPGFSQIGAVTSEGDVDSRANLVRAQGYNGTGVTVGVISDGINSLPSAQATGDLGPVTVPPGCQAGSGDEGTAMLEIVHDLAPGARLLFSTGVPGFLTFINSVNCLKAAEPRSSSMTKCISTSRSSRTARRR